MSRLAALVFDHPVPRECRQAIRDAGTEPERLTGHVAALASSVAPVVAACLAMSRLGDGVRRLRVDRLTNSR